LSDTDGSSYVYKVSYPLEGKTYVYSNIPGYGKLNFLNVLFFNI